MVKGKAVPASTSHEDIYGQYRLFHSFLMLEPHNHDWLTSHPDYFNPSTH